VGGDKLPAKEALWVAFQEAANVTLVKAKMIGSEQAKNLEILRDELEALDDIFGSECTIVVKGGWTTVSLAFEEGAMSLEVVVQDGVYPAAYPKSVLVSGTWSSRQGGSYLHVELITFLASLGLGEPMIFEIHGHVQVVLQSILDRDVPSVSLLSPDTSQVSKADIFKTNTTAYDSNDQKTKERSQSTVSRASAIRRPRERGHFWSTHPTKAPPATPFPNIPILLAKTRKSLPAATARAEFLAVLKKADEVRLPTIYIQSASAFPH
jgi:hypothetical protein